MSYPMPVVVREARETDTAYLASTIARSGELPGRRHLCQDCARTMLSAWKAGGGVRLVAVDEADPDAIIGYVCAAPPVLHHVYVRAEFRGQGVARKLFEALSGPCERASLPFRGARS